MDRTFFVKRVNDTSFEVENLKNGTYMLGASSTREMIARVGQTSVYRGWFWDEQGEVIHVFQDDRP